MFACLFIPNFRLQAALRWHEYHGAAVVVDESASKGIVQEANDVAQAAGIFAGMTSSQALAREGRVLIRIRSFAQEKCLNHVLMEAGLGISPKVELTRDGVCVADLHDAKPGTCWQRLADGCVAHLQEKSVRALVGIAPTPDLAELAARGADPVAVIYDAPAFVKALPLEALEPSEELLTLLGDWGVRSIGEFQDLPRSEVVERLGPEADALLNKVSARHKRPLRLMREPASYAEAYDFEYEVETVEPLLFLLRRFLDDLCGRMHGAYRVVQKMTLQLILENESRHERSFCVPSPTSSVEVLFRILTTHLEGLQLDKRPVGLRLDLEPAAPEKNQLQLFESALRDPNLFGETLAKLKAFLGNEHVGVPEKGNSFRPDHFVMKESFGLPAENRMKGMGIPLHRYRPAVYGAVEIKEGRLTAVSSAVANGTINSSAGPYFSSGEWWDAEKWETEEWDVELEDGSMYRLSRRDGRWRLEGVYE